MAAFTKINEQSPRYREIIAEFLEIYKCLPSLWDNDDKFYTNKEARDAAYSLLLKKYREFDDTATVDTVKKKIENMRTSYKREQKKISTLKRTPTLWYYHLLTFLEKNFDDCTYLEIGDKSFMSGDEDEESILRTILINKTDDEDLEAYEPSQKKVKVEEEEEYLIENFDDKCTEKDVIYLHPDNITVANDNDVDEGDAGNLSINKTVNEPESFGKTIGLQLGELNQMQRTIAEKLISEVIFYGRLNKLTLESNLHLNDF